MGIRESLLNTITSVADSDFVRIVTAAGASSKATVRNLFKGFESNLSAKSNLTNSDYIRVVGSDNEAYKQSVSAVKTAMGIDTLSSNLSVIYGTSYTKALTASDDLRTLAEGTYRINGTHPVGMPSGVSGLNYGWVTITNRASSVYRYYDLNVGQGDFGQYKRIFGWSSASSTSDAIAWQATGTEVDYIVEQGTSGIWTYRKWNSGIAECWGWYTHTVSTWSAWGSVYESNRGMTTYPSGLFTGTYPICNVAYQSGSLGTAAMSIELSGGSTTDTPTFWIVRPSSGGTGNALIGLRAIGRWK